MATQDVKIKDSVDALSKSSTSSPSSALMRKFHEIPTLQAYMIEGLPVFCGASLVFLFGIEAYLWVFSRFVDLKNVVVFIEKGVVTKEEHLMIHTICHIMTLRRNIKAPHLLAFLKQLLLLVLRSLLGSYHIFPRFDVWISCWFTKMEFINVHKGLK